MCFVARVYFLSMCKVKYGHLNLVSALHVLLLFSVRNCCKVDEKEASVFKEHVANVAHKHVAHFLYGQMDPLGLL